MSLPAIMKLIKGVSARNVNQLLGSSGPLWQEESFDHVLRTDESFLEKREYIRQNPVRARLVISPEDYRWLWIPVWSGHSCPLRLTLSLLPKAATTMAGRPTLHQINTYCNFAYSALASFRIGISVSASFHSARKS